MDIIIDTREQLPYIDVFDRLKINYYKKALRTGDYSIKGHENKFALERKTLNDFISSITSGRERFIKEMKRASAFTYFAVIIETSYFDIKHKNYYSDVPPKVILNTIFSWSTKYNMPFFLVGSREGGALATVKLAEFYLKNVAK